MELRANFGRCMNTIKLLFTHKLVLLNGRNFYNFSASGLVIEIDRQRRLKIERAYLFKQVIAMGYGGKIDELRRVSRGLPLVSLLPPQSIATTRFHHLYRYIFFCPVCDVYSFVEKKRYLI